MFQIKLMLFAIVALMAIDSTFAIIGGQSASRSQFPYFALLKTHRLKYYTDYWTGDFVVILLYFTLNCFFFWVGERKDVIISNNMSMSLYVYIFSILVLNAVERSLQINML